MPLARAWARASSLQAAKPPQTERAPSRAATPPATVRRSRNVLLEQKAADGVVRRTPHRMVMPRESAERKCYNDRGLRTGKALISKEPCSTLALAADPGNVEGDEGQTWRPSAPFRPVVHPGSTSNILPNRQAATSRI